MTIRNASVVTLRETVVALVCAAGSALAGTATWTSTADGATGTWTEPSNWNAAAYPGQDGAYQGAFLTNRASGASYTAVVDAALPNTVGTVEIKNAGAGGAATLLVTNTAFKATNLLIRANGTVRVEAAGVITNLWAFSLDDAGGTLALANGGALSCGNNVFVGTGSGGRSNVLSLGEGTVFAVTNGYLYLGNSAGANWNQLLVPGNNVRLRTSNVCVIGVGSLNNTALFTGTNIAWDLGGNVQMRVGQGAAARSNALIVSQGSLALNGQGTLNIGLSAGATDNALIVTNGGRFSSVRTVLAGYGTSNNLILVTGPGSVWDGGSAQQKAGDSGGCYNRILVDDRGTVTNASIWVGTGNASSHWNSMVLTNGARWIVGTGGDSTIGYGGVSNSVVATGSGTFWNLGARTLFVGSSSTNNSCSSATIAEGAVVTNGAVIVGAGLSASQSSLVVTNGGQLFTGTSACIVGNPASNNLLLVTGPGSLWNDNQVDIRVGSGTSAFGNVLRVEESGQLVNAGFMYVGNSKAQNNTLAITRRGQCWVASGKSFYVGNVASSNAVLVAGSGSALSSQGNLANGNLFIGGTQLASSNSFTVCDGATSIGWNQIYVGRFSNSTDNALIVTRGGFLQGSLVRVAYQGSNAWNNTIAVTDRGILEAGQSGLQIDQAPAGPLGNNTITNGGGVYQFTHAAPAITPAPANNSFIYLTDGAIAFRGVTGVSVKGNQTGSLTNIVFGGTCNAFRLIASTNAASPDQSYTFTDSLGPTNYARLELDEGSLYRGGSVTVGSGGVLAATGAPSAISNLTFASGSALEMTLDGTNSASRLIALGSVTLAGSLRLTLSGPPPPAGVTVNLIDKRSPGAITGQFGNGRLTVSYNDVDYVFRLDAAGGDGNDLTLRNAGRAGQGTAILIL